MKSHRFQIILVILAVALVCYAKWIEPYWIEVTRYQLMGHVDRPLKVIQLSDLHTNGFGFREKRVLEIVRNEHPDVILISGDTVSNEGDWNSVDVLLTHLHAPFGVFLFRGNWEYWRPNFEELKTYEKSGISFLNNEARPLTKKIWLVGLDDSLAGNPDQTRAFSQVPRNAFVITLFHSPQYFDSLKANINLALSGHTHGGQLRIPFLPPFWLPDGSGSYVAGWYERGSSRMYVSRGVGNSIVDMRFACRPEVTVFQIEPIRK